MPMLDIQRRHAEVFRLRFGEKGRTGAPQKLTDAIRVTSPSAAVVQAFVDVFGGDVKPWNGGEGAQFEAYLPTTELPIMVLPGQSLTQWWESWKGSVCERRCDGFTEQLSGQACRCPADITERMKAANACRPMTRVAVLCPDVDVVGAGSFVSHGMIAAETLPQAIAVAEAALARGLMVPGVVRVIEHKGKRHYVVPQIEIVGVSLRALATGEIPDAALSAGGRPELASPPQAAIAPAPAQPSAARSAKKTAAKTTAAKKSAPAREQPPLPGEEADRLASPEERLVLSEALAALDVEMRARVLEEWDAKVGQSFKAAERFTFAHHTAATALVDEVRHDVFLRRQKHANAAMGAVDIRSDEARHALVAEATRALGEGLQTSSTGELSENQLAAIVDYCAALKTDDEPASAPEEATG